MPFYFLLAIFMLILMRQVNACEVMDDTGHLIKSMHPAQRIVSLAPDLTEILFAAGAGDKIVGVVKGSDYPLTATKIPIVATYNSIDLEKILVLHPDLIIAWTETSYISQLNKLGIPIYLSHQKKLTDIANTLEKFGCLAGTEKQANLASRNYLQRYHALQKKYSNSKPLTVFYQVWATPLMTITKNSWINEIITLCGGKNIFADLNGVAVEVNVEGVVVANPEVIIGTQTDGLKQWQAWPKIRAVHTKHIYAIDPDLIERASPRVLNGVEEVCWRLSA
ncbi:MAG: cobalamin-binding protein [Gammaproteobacteria bacterium]|nr:cobalamin-binding protein [Gammaproteobacteria bacterium]